MNEEGEERMIGREGTEDWEGRGGRGEGLYGKRRRRGKGWKSREGRE